MAREYQTNISDELKRNATGTLHDARLIRWRRQAEVFEGSNGLRLHVNTAKSNAEVNAIHRAAQPTAMFYVTTILIMYLFGLLAIFIHYLNSSYGKWTWTLSDAWDELTPAFFNQSQKVPNETNGNYPDTKQKRSVSERNDEIVGEEEEVRFRPEQENNWKTNLDSSNVSSGCSGQTGITSLPSDGDEMSSDKDKKTPMISNSSCKKFLSPSSAITKRFVQRKSNNPKSDIERCPNSDSQAKSRSDTTVDTDMLCNIENSDKPLSPSTLQSETFQQHHNNEAEDIIVISDETQFNEN